MLSNFVVRNCRCAIAAVLVAAAAVAGSSAQAAVPSGFSDVTTISGLTNPTNVQFAPDGWIFAATKSGRICGYSSLTDAGSLVADLSTEVDDYWDRGLLGLAISPTFTTDHSIWVLYSFDAAIGGTAPAWNDACPTPPGATTDGCVISGRLAKLSLTTNTSGRYVLAPGGEKVLLNDWCQQFPSHSQGALRFGADGYLYASSGDGASFNSEDFGQLGHTYAADPYNPCGDPPGGVGTQLASPTAEGGALRAQSATRPAGQAVSLDGSIIRVDPNTGAAAPGN